MAKTRKLAVELKVDWRSGSLSWRVPSEGSKWAFVDEHKKDAWLKRNGVPKSAITDLKRRDKTTFKTANVETWQYMYGIEEDAGTLSGMKNKGGSMKLSKVLLVGSVGLVGVGIFMWYRSRKAATEAAYALTGSSAPANSGVMKSYKAAQLDPAILRRMMGN